MRNILTVCLLLLTGETVPSNTLLAQDSSPDTEISNADEQAPVSVGGSKELSFLGVPEKKLNESPGNWGGVSGQILFEGKPPRQRYHFRKNAFVKDRKFCATQDMPDEWLVIHPENQGIAHCFVYLHRKPKRTHPLIREPRKKVLIHREVRCRFEPHTMIVRVGQRVDVKNRDSIAHNSHYHALHNQQSSIIAVPNDTVQGLFTPSRKEILPIRVTCDIHNWMTAYWLVTDHPYAAITDYHGRFRISGLPAGEHEFRIWHESAGYLTRRLNVTVRAVKVSEIPVLKFGIKQFKSE